MLLLSEFRAYVTECVNAIPELQHGKVVMDDGQITKFLKDEVKTTDNHILMAIIPKHNPFGDVDMLQTRNTAAFLVLKKIDRSDVTHDQYLDMLEQSQLATKKLWDKMLTDHLNAGENCNIMGKLKIDTLDINPVWGLASCDGYEIDFSLDT